MLLSKKKRRKYLAQRESLKRKQAKQAKESLGTDVPEKTVTIVKCNIKNIKEFM